jgi:hypothetical protein
LSGNQTPFGPRNPGEHIHYIDWAVITPSELFRMADEVCINLNPHDMRTKQGKAWRDGAWMLWTEVRDRLAAQELAAGKTLEAS